MGDVIDSTLMHINKEKAYGRQGKAPTGLIFDPNRLLPPPPPGLTPRALAFFWPWMAKSLGWGLLSCQIPRGRKKRANAPSFVNTATFFIDCTVE